MSSKQIEAWVMVLGSVFISLWMVWKTLGAGVPATASGAAWEVLWAIGYVIVFNIVAMIAGVILVSIAQREEVKDERADERDRFINARSMGTAYFVSSIGVLAVLVWLAFGLGPNLVPYALFAVGMAAGAASAVSKLVLYRIN
ncbi:MAG: hypothetical protein ABL879_12300 [Devosia sp.]